MFVFLLLMLMFMLMRKWEQQKTNNWVRSSYVSAYVAGVLTCLCYAYACAYAQAQEKGKILILWLALMLASLVKTRLKHKLSSYVYAYAYVQWGHRWNKHKVLADWLIVLRSYLCQHVLTGHYSDVSRSIRSLCAREESRDISISFLLVLMLMLTDAYV